MSGGSGDRAWRVQDLRMQMFRSRGFCGLEFRSLQNDSLVAAGPVGDCAFRTS